MQDRFYYKIAFIFGLMAFLMIPQTVLKGLIGERQDWQHQALLSIRQSWPGPQTLAGPVISVPYQLTGLVTEKVSDGTERTITREVTTRAVAHLLPSQLDIRGQLDASRRSRGIYEVPVYAGTMRVSGEFNTQPLLDVAAAHKDKAIRWENPILSVLVSDQRGIASPAKLQWDGASLAFKPGTTLSEAGDGMHVRLPDLDPSRTTALPFAFDLELRGMQSLCFAQLAENSDIQLSANWPHPSFNGDLLPETRDVGETGFSAHWKTSSFSSNIATAYEHLRSGKNAGLLRRGVQVSLVQPGDVYQQAERCIKYALLFLMLTFGTMILFELLKTAPIHPVQYAFVGLALLIFYLLLVALSERIGFLLAYATASTACTALLTCYFGAILRGRKLGLILGCGLSALYAILYVILQSEDNALIMGSVLLFVVLAALMLTTRHFDWYALTRPRAPKPNPPVNDDAA